MKAISPTQKMWDEINAVTYFITTTKKAWKFKNTQSLLREREDYNFKMNLNKWIVNPDHKKGLVKGYLEKQQISYGKTLLPTSWKHVIKQHIYIKTT